jgi:hypothetical protein
MPDSYGPSKAAFNHAVNALEARTKADVALEDLSEAFDALHDPALGLDRSVCLRDVIDLLREASGEDERGTFNATALSVTADWLERKWSDA